MFEEINVLQKVIHIENLIYVYIRDKKQGIKSLYKNTHETCENNFFWRLAQCGWYFIVSFT